jgi:Asp-tRNA(Asn)/Glu-tRNA(Gln) amidotransferase A subunit family amidase
MVLFHLLQLLSEDPAYNPYMSVSSLTLHDLREALASGTAKPSELASRALKCSNRNAGQNTFLWQNQAWTMSEAARSSAIPRGKGGPFGDGRSPLWGVPISVKDCFDLASSPTSCGVRFYRDLHGPASRDSWLVEQLRSAGAVIIGKTHLHPLAYGITGENPEFGDCGQPGNTGALTGGSSSGAAASVLEGSAVAAIGTDTGGSIRVPAALCGLAGYRASWGRGNWRGAAHLAQSFDTMGWLFRDLRDGPMLAETFALAQPLPARRYSRFAVVDESFLPDCEPEIVDSLRSLARELEMLGLRPTSIDVSWWTDSFEIFAPIQAWEAARIHAGYFDKFEPTIRERLEWGARISDAELAALRRRHVEFRARIDELLATHDLLLLPASPVARLAAGADHSQTRSLLLRYTTPFSLAGVPVVTIPCIFGGMQLAAARGSDESLLELTAQIGAFRTAPK